MDTPKIPYGVIHPDPFDYDPDAFSDEEIDDGLEEPPEEVVNEQN